jgi:hypothetical protein
MPDSGVPEHDPNGGERPAPPWQQGAPPPPPAPPRPSTPSPAAGDWDEWDDERRPDAGRSDATGVLPVPPPGGVDPGRAAPTEMAEAADAPPSGAPGVPPAGFPAGPPGAYPGGPGGPPSGYPGGPPPTGPGPRGQGPGTPPPWAGTERPGGPPPGYRPAGAAASSGGEAPPRPPGAPSGPPPGQPFAPPPGGPPPGRPGGGPPGYGTGYPPAGGRGGPGQAPPFAGPGPMPPGQTPPGYPPGGPAGSPGPSGPGPVESLLRAPWLLGALGIVAGYIIAQLSDVIYAFQHFPGLPARARLLRFFGNATIGWAIALAVAVVLVSLAGRYYPVHDESARTRLHLARLMVAGLAAFTVLSAVVDLIAALIGVGTDTSGAGGFGPAVYSAIGLPAGIDGAFTAALTYLAVAVISAAVALWAFGLSRIHDQ